MPRAFRFALVALSAACSSAESPSTPPVLYYDGPPTDEALAHMNSLPAEPGAPLTILSPTEGATLARDVPPTIVFSEGAAALDVLPKRRRHPFAQWVRSIDRWFGIASAQAHGTPYNGVAYLITISDATGSGRLQVFTDKTSFAIPAADWSDLSAFPSPFRIAITSATFEENLVTAGGGPFDRSHASFSIR